MSLFIPSPRAVPQTREEALRQLRVMLGQLPWDCVFHERLAESLIVLERENEDARSESGGCENGCSMA